MKRIFCSMLCILLIHLGGLTASMLSDPSIFRAQNNYSTQQSYKTFKIGEVYQSGSLVSQLQKVVDKNGIEIIFDNIELSILYENSGVVAMKDVFAYEALSAILESFDISYEVKINGTVWTYNSTSIHIESDVSFNDIVVSQIDSNSKTLGNTLWRLSQETGVNFVLDKVRMSALSKNISLSMKKVSLLDILKAISTVSRVDFVIESDNNLIKVRNSELKY